MNERNATILNFASRLRFPWLFLFTAALFALDFLVLDPIPFIDELLLGLLTLLLGTWKKKKQELTAEFTR